MTRSSRGTYFDRRGENDATNYATNHATNDATNDATSRARRGVARVA